jgi:hypothetical protein
MHYSLQVLSFAIVAASLGACRRGPTTPPPHRSLVFGDGTAIVESVLKPILTSHESTFGEISWGGTSSSDEFSVTDQLVIKAISVREVSTLLEKRLELLPEERGWNDHAGNLSERHLEISYAEGGARFWIDFVLFQEGPDTDVLILHKGIRE